MGPNPQVTADLVTFTEEMLNGRLNFLCSKQPAVKGVLRRSRRKQKARTICHHILLCRWVIVLLHITKDIIL